LILTTLTYFITLTSALILFSSWAARLAVG